MKGVYSSPDALMSRYTQQLLFPDNAYHVDSGGDPNVIPSLTFDQFVSFHSSTYHPSNSRAYFYGNDDLMKRLDIIDSYYSDFNQISTSHTKIAIQKFKNLEENDIYEVAYPSSGGEDLNKRMFTINWLLNEEFLTTKDRMKLNILNHLLLGTTASDLYKILIDSKLGESVIGGGLSEELQQATYGIGMKGVNKNNIQQLEELIKNSLLNISLNGFNSNAIESSLNTIEFSIREFNTGGYPKGLSFMLEALNHWIYDYNPLDSLQFEQILYEIKNEIYENSQFFFQNLIEKYFLKNSHCIRIIMKPDIHLEDKLIFNEKEKMKNIQKLMTKKELENIQILVEKLRYVQETEDTPEAKATIPKLTLNDLDSNEKDIPTIISQLSYQTTSSTTSSTSASGPTSMNVTVLEHDIPSSGILYTEIGFDFSRISIHDLPLLSIFSNLLVDSGTTTMDEVTFSRYIGSMTGGVDVSWYTDLKNYNNVVSDSNDVLLYLIISSKCTSNRITEMYQILYDVLVNSRLDNQKKALEILLQTRSRRVNSVTSSGHRYAAKKLFSNMSFLGYYNEHTSGLTYLQALDDLIEQVTNNWNLITKRLENIRHILLNNFHINRLESPPTSSSTGSSGGSTTSTSKDNVIINLTGDQTLLNKSKESLQNLINELVKYPSISNQCVTNTLPVVEEWKSLKSPSPSPPIREGITVSSQVNYVTKGGSIYQPGEIVKGSTAVVARYLSGNYLWDMVRVIGGAYGGSGSFSATSGRYLFTSYRDPNLLQTLETYDKSSEFLLKSNNLSTEDITQSIIATIGDIDSPLFVDQKGDVAMKRYLRNESYNERLQWRTEILQTTRDDFLSFGLRLETLKVNGGIVVVGSKAALEAANAELIAQGKQPLNIQPAFVSTHEGEEDMEMSEGEEESG